jgi:signal transduction histidine kinase
MAQARASVLTLRADPLAGRALATALAALARRLTSETGMRVTLHQRGPAALPYETEGELFRIASEALANARLHANASRIEIELGGDETSVVLRIHDDGSGFDPALRDDDRYGLVGMEERARIAGGSLRVVSGRGDGTLIEAVVPRARG